MNNKDYDIIKGKLPRFDKEGNDISKDKIGKGGRHRDDGTYSGTAYDIEIINDSEANDKLSEEKNNEIVGVVLLFAIPFFQKVIIPPCKKFAEEQLYPFACEKFAEIKEKHKLKKEAKLKNKSSENIANVEAPIAPEEDNVIFFDDLRKRA